jgi:two-component system sensor histidine kinase DesK
MRMSERWGGGVWMGRGLIWLGFIFIPLITALASHGSPAQHVLTAAAALVFIAAYMTLILTWRRGRPLWLTIGLFATLVAVSIGLTLGDRSGWGFLFTYCAACTAMLPSSRFGFFAVLGCSGLAAATTLLAGGGGGAAVGWATSSLGIGLLMLVMRDLRVRNEELCAARAELAELAVAEERERFARDLHDLLGHSLSVIALKAELAGRLVRERPEDAGREIAELEQVARTALGEVREAVSGYRRPTLDDELAGARMALTAAGIEPEVHRAHLTLAPETEAVLAWAVREGATNVIRHSRARRCTITVSGCPEQATVEIVDDGAAAAPVGAGAGHGITGLAERARAVGGELEAAAETGAGFRLAVAVPAG